MTLKELKLLQSVTLKELFYCWAWHSRS